MRVLVTGGAGKLGHWVVQELCSAKGAGSHEIVVLDLSMPENPIAGCHYLVGNVDNFGEVVEAATGAEAIVHLAAIRKPGLTSDGRTFTTNVLGTYNVHRAASILNIGHVVSTSSSAVYGWTYRVRNIEPPSLPLTEESPTTPQDSYGLSKVVGESIARWFADATGGSAIVLRPPWIIDPLEASQLRRQGGRPPTSSGDLMAYVDVRDLADAYRLALESRLQGFHVFNVNAPDTTVLGNARDHLATLDPALLAAARDLPVNESFISAGRAQDVLGWTTRWLWRAANDDDDDEPDHS
jgi:nucleoside-diphosphate-sugar epimerase